MAILVILVLAILWAAVLVPPILRSRAEGGTTGGVSDFFGRLRDGLGGGRGHGDALPALQPIIGPMGNPVGPVTNGAAPLGPVRVPGAMSPAQRRRRDVLVGLLGLAALMFLMAAFSGSMIFWVLHLLADVALGVYVYMLLQIKSRNTASKPRQQPIIPAEAVPPVLPNVHDLAARRFPPATQNVERGGRVLAFRRSATSW